MDKYELLEELEKLTDINHQLADRIAELEKNFDALNAKHTKLVTQQSSEPVAWILESDNSPTEFCWDEKELDEITDVYDMEGWNYKVYPVYTHPAKTLTDEEWALLKKVALIAWGTANECSPCAEEFCKQSQSDMLNLLEKTGSELKAMIEKHEAILRKAQEK